MWILLYMKYIYWQWTQMAQSPRSRDYHLPSSTACRMRTGQHLSRTRYGARIYMYIHIGNDHGSNTNCESLCVCCAIPVVCYTHIPYSTHVCCLCAVCVCYVGGLWGVVCWLYIVLSEAINPFADYEQLCVCVFVGVCERILRVFAFVVFIHKYIYFTCCRQ